MATNETLHAVAVDGAADPNVRIPDHVRRASEDAARIHAQAYQPAEDPAATAAAAEAARAAAAQTAAEGQITQPQPEPQSQADFTGPADVQALHDSEWARRYNSMQGRWAASERSRAAMEVQMGELGQELVRTQNLLTQVQTAQPQARPNAPQATHHENLITPKDREDYGDELVDLAKRAALSAVGPQMDALQAENARLTKQVQSTSRRDLFAKLDGAVPSWREINTSVQFKSWLRLPNVYTRQLRGNMLKAAVDGADAPQVIALLKDFLSEASATGQQVPMVQAEQPATLAPREAALSLETLAAPGRARPATGDSQMPADKPIYSRADISKFYEDSRKGLYAGRTADYDRIQNDLTAAQREGRIRG